MRSTPLLLSALLLTPSAAQASAAAPASFQDSSQAVPTLAEAVQLQSSGRFADAVQAFEEIVANDPNSAGGWFNLGYSLHMLGQYDRALEAHLKAATFPNPQTQTLAHYNAACVYALTDRPDQAFQALAKARKAGFNNLAQVVGDSDLTALHGDPRFDELLVALGGNPQPTATVPSLPDEIPSGERALDFTVGNWNVLSGGNLIETVTVERILEQQGLRMTAPSHQSLLTWVEPAGEWRWTWVSSRGHHDLLSGGVEDGRVVMDQPILRDRPGYIGRCILEDVGESAFTLVWNVSNDDGKTWHTESQQRWVRQGTRAQAVPASFVPSGAPTEAKRFAPQLGLWDITVHRMNPDQSKVRGQGSAKIWWCEDGNHLHQESTVHYDNWTTSGGTTYRSWNADAGHWDVSWEGVGGGAAVASVGREQDGEYVEVREGSDNHGAFVDESRTWVDEHVWSSRTDRTYADGTTIEGIWSVKATRIL